MFSRVKVGQRRFGIRAALLNERASFFYQRPHSKIILSLPLKRIKFSFTCAVMVGSSVSGAAAGGIGGVLLQVSLRFAEVAFLEEDILARRRYPRVLVCKHQYYFRPSEIPARSCEESNCATGHCCARARARA